MADGGARSRRNFIFVPGLRPDRFAKALAIAPDMVTVDLEDAVLPRDKAEARALTLPLFAEHADDTSVEKVVRVTVRAVPTACATCWPSSNWRCRPTASCCPRSRPRTRSVWSIRF